MRTYDVSGRPRSRDFASRDANDLTDVDGWRYIDYPSGSLWSAAGQIKNGNARNAEIYPDIISAIPFLAPYRGGILSGVAYHDRGSHQLEILTPAPAMHIGIYNNAYPGLLYPSGLIFQTGLYINGTAGVGTSTRVYGSCNIPLEPCGLYWAVIAESGTTKRLCAGIQSNAAINLLGFDSEFNPQPAWGYSGSYPTDSRLPDVFPTGMHFANSDNVPLIFYAFGA